LGGDLQGTPTQHLTSHITPLAEVCNTTSLTHIGDPTIPTYLPSHTPLDHWLLRLPPSASHRHVDTTTTPVTTNHSDHCALTTLIPQIGDNPTQTLPTTTPLPTTRSHPPFLLPIPKPFIDLYQLGDANTTKAQLDASTYIAKLTDSPTITTTTIDKAADHIITMLNAYHELAQKTWPMAQTGPPPKPKKMHTPLTNSDNRQLKRLTKLRNDANRLNTKNEPTTHKSQKQPTDLGLKKKTTHTSTQVSTILQLTEPHKIEDIPSLCHKLSQSLSTKQTENSSTNLGKRGRHIKKSPKRYHANLKTSAGLQPRAKDQPSLSTIRDPETNEITTQPQAILDIVHSHYKQEHSRTTPDNLPTPPWQNPDNPDYYETKPKDPNKAQHTLDHYLFRGHYNMAY
jgi:hypothetical protein